MLGPKGRVLLSRAGLPAQDPAHLDQGISPVPPQPGGSCQRREGRILFSVATPERTELMGLKCIKVDFG